MCFLLSLLYAFFLKLNSNLLGGAIPTELGHCLSLSTLNLGNNELNGSIVEGIPNLPQLQCLVLSHNRLTGHIPSNENPKYFRQDTISDSTYVHHRGVFDLSFNQLSGEIPEELGSCLVIVDLLLSKNRFSGLIPKSLSQLPNLTTLDMSENELRGEIPMEFRHALSLQGLYLGNNCLAGAMPESLGLLVGLVKLNLTGNKLSGQIPSSFGNLHFLTHLDFSSNLLEGHLPQSLTNMVNIVGFYAQQNRLSGHLDELFTASTVWRIEILNLSSNSFSGVLPPSLGNMSYLTCLDLHENGFAGGIPGEIGNLTQLEYLDLSRNRLSSRIPDPICHLPNLKYFNFAENDLADPVPGIGTCQNLSRVSAGGSRNLILSAVMAGTLTVTVLAVFLLRRKKWNPKNGGGGRRRRGFDDDGDDDPEKPSGGDGSAIDRRLYFQTNAKSKEPPSINIAMFEQSLLKITLVNILEATDNFCRTNIIGDGGFRTVYRATLSDGKTVAVKKLSHGKTQGTREFLAEMETVGKKSRPQSLQFLDPPLSACETHVSTDIAGTFGYIPPEYGQTGRSTTRGDMYSFGVILLELVSSREPTGPEFKDGEGGNLVGWASKKMKKGQAVDVLDLEILDADSKPMMLQTLQIASLCLSDNPASRPTMLQVVKLLKGIRDD
ncbi:unnamed protein product [Cuscuta campestris]|uniref:Protein kinase domain-containing protein n=1 Tax=Cuscuta campestris TaxID=132261 RepID=A0A484MFV1_9ASTE|nr:unnamed protein product [Cuscuta campestris]